MFTQTQTAKNSQKIFPFYVKCSNSTGFHVNNIIFKRNNIIISKFSSTLQKLNFLPHLMFSLSEKMDPADRPPDMHQSIPQQFSSS